MSCFNSYYSHKLYQQQVEVDNRYCGSDADPGVSYLDAAAIREAHVILQKFPSTSPIPHYIVFCGFLINFSMITLLCLTFFPVYSREIKLFYHTSDSLLQGD